MTSCNLTKLCSAFGFFCVQIDFERWKSEDDEEDFSDTNIKNGNAKDILGDYPELFEKLKKDEFGYKKGSLL